MSSESARRLLLRSGNGVMSFEVIGPATLLPWREVDERLVSILPLSFELDGVFMCKDPGASGVQNRAKEAMARNIPLAGVVMENSGRSWHVPS